MFYGSSKQILSSSYVCMDLMCSQGWTATYTGTAYIQMDGPSGTFTPYKVALTESTVT